MNGGTIARSTPVTAELAELAALLVRTLETIEGDIEALKEVGEEAWPRTIVEAVEQRDALAATLKRAVVLVPEHADALRAYYLEEYGRACWMGGPAPILPLMPETVEQLREVSELVRRARILDGELDAACRREER